MLRQSSNPNRSSVEARLVQADVSLMFAETGERSMIGTPLLVLLLFQLMGDALAAANFHEPGPKAIWSAEGKNAASPVLRPGMGPRLEAIPSPTSSFRLASLRSPVLVRS